MTFWGFIDWFIHPRLKADPEEFRRARQLVVFGWAGIILFYPPMALKWLKMGSVELAVSISACGLLALTVVFLLKFTGSLAVTGNGMIAGLAWHFFYLPYLTGGFHSTGLAWNIVMPVIAFTFLTLRGSIFWTLVLMAEVIYYYVLRVKGVDLPAIPLPEKELLQNQLSNIIGPLLAAFITGFFVDRARQKAFETQIQALDGQRSALARQAAAAEETSRLAGHLASMLERVGGNARSLAQASDGLRTVSLGMEELAARNTDQAAEAAERAQVVHRHMSAVTEAVDRTGASLAEMDGQVRESLEVTREAIRRAQRSDELVRRLGESGTEIGLVTEVITGIADHVRLLALNATIEAARAGEAGKGFAVVAGEVKDLAGRATRSTAEISDRIRAMQELVGEVVQEIHRITQIIGQVGSIQEEINSSVAEQNGIAGDIQGRVRESARSSQAILDVVTTLSDSVGRTQGGIAGLLESAGRLAAMAQELKAACETKEPDPTPASRPGVRRK